MVLTNAEKQRRYRERRNADEHRREANLCKDRERWHKNKQLAKDMSERQHRLAKRKWTRYKRAQRQRRQITLSPPPTPTSPVPRFYINLFCA